MTKLGGGLKSGIKQQDLTRRLDDNLSSSDFDKSRRPNRLTRHLKSLSERMFYAIIFVALFFCAIRFTLQTFFAHKTHAVLAPILGKNTAVVEQILTGSTEDDTKDTAEKNPDATDKQQDDKDLKKPPGAAKRHGHNKKHKQQQHRSG